MGITISLDNELVRHVRQIAVERGTTVTALVRTYMEELVAEHGRADRKRRGIEALENSFRCVQIKVGNKTWRREDLYTRS